MIQNVCPVTSKESMLEAIKALGIVPLFSNVIPGYSIEELTPDKSLFNMESIEMGPWDWKIHCVQSGEVAYGKFLLGGRAAFATFDWYRELMNYRRSLAKCHPKGMEKKVYKAICEAGGAMPSDLRKAFNVKKGRMDTMLAHLEYDTLVLTGDIIRVYTGPDLHYSGWQRSSVCPADSLLSTDEEDFAGIFLGSVSKPARKEPKKKPAESYELLFRHIQEICPQATDSEIRKVIG